MCYHTAAEHHQGSPGSQADGTGREGGELCQKNYHHLSKLVDLCPSRWVSVLAREFLEMEEEKEDIKFIMCFLRAESGAEMGILTQ